MPSGLRTLEQERAKHAWSCIQQVKNEEFASEYRSIALKAASFIMTNGLGQTLAFLKAKGKGELGNEHEALYQHLSKWVQKRVQGQMKIEGGQMKIEGGKDLLDWIVNNANSQQYRLATMEALALLRWLKRFAEAELPRGEE